MLPWCFFLSLSQLVQLATLKWIGWSTLCDSESFDAKKISQKSINVGSTKIYDFYDTYIFMISRKSFVSREVGPTLTFIFLFTMENISRLTTNLIWIENGDTTRLGSTRARGRVMGWHDDDDGWRWPRKWCWKWANKDYSNRRIHKSWLKMFFCLSVWYPQIELSL